MGILKFIFVLMVLVPFAIFLFYFLDKMLDILPKSSDYPEDEFYTKEELKERRKKNKKRHKENARIRGDFNDYGDHRRSEPVMSRKELKERVKEEKRIEKEERKAAKHAKRGSRSGRQGREQHYEEQPQPSHLRSANAGYHRPEGERRSLQEELEQASRERQRQSFDHYSSYGDADFGHSSSSQSRQRSRASSGSYVPPSAYASARSTENKLREASKSSSSSRSRSSSRRSSKKRKSKGRVNRQQ